METRPEISARPVLSGPTVIDTSAWIEALRSDGSGRARTLVDQAIEVGLAVIVDPVRAELAIGVRSRKDRETLAGLLDVLPCLHVEPRTWRAAGELGVMARSSGLTIPLVDLVIAALVLDNGFELLHADRHFTLLSAVTHLPQSWALEGD